MGSDKRVSRSERSGRYGSDQGRSRDSRSRRDRDRDVERDHDYRRYNDDRRSDRHEDRRVYDSPERHHDRRGSDKSDDSYHSDGEYQDHDYRNEDIGDETESKTIMLRGLSLNATEHDIRATFESYDGPRPADVRLMKRKSETIDCSRKDCSNALQ